MSRDERVGLTTTLDRPTVSPPRAAVASALEPIHGNLGFRRSLAGAAHWQELAASGAHLAAEIIGRRQSLTRL
jgi:hypothetical protein